MTTPRHGRYYDSRTTLMVRRIVAQIRDEIPTVMITAPIVVPIWWVLWKVCDSLWGLS